MCAQKLNNLPEQPFRFFRVDVSRAPRPLGKWFTEIESYSTIFRHYTLCGGMVAVMEPDETSLHMAAFLWCDKKVIVCDSNLGCVSQNYPDAIFAYYKSPVVDEFGLLYRRTHQPPAAAVQ
jgi:hypothetical protein